MVDDYPAHAKPSSSFQNGPNQSLLQENRISLAKTKIFNILSQTHVKTIKISYIDWRDNLSDIFRTRIANIQIIPAF